MSNENTENSTGCTQVRVDYALGRIWAFVIYTVLFEAMVWGLFGWAVFVQGHSGWWILAAITISGAQLKPSHFGITP